MIKKLLLITIVFVGVFFITTAFVDSICQMCGYYQVGINEEQELFK